MQSQTTPFSFTRLLLIAFGFFAVWLIHNASGRFPLYLDESQYWDWARSFEWGYYSKPPMVAWSVYFTTGLCGDGEFCIRLGAALAHLATALLLYATGAELFNRRVAFYSALTYLTIPAVTLSSGIISTDPFLLLFWALTIYCVLRALRSDRWSWWLLTGIAAGLGMLSKYNFAFFLPSLLLYLHFTGQLKQTLSSLKIWVAGGVATLVYLPNFIWNWHNHFVSYLHTNDNANLSGELFNPKKFLEFFGTQFGVLGPILFAVLVYLLLRFKSLQPRSDKRTLFLLCFITPFLLSILALSFISRAHGNWAVPAYIPGIVLVVWWLLETGRLRWLHASLALHMFAALVFFAWYPLLDLAHVPLSAEIDPAKRMRGNGEFGEALKERLKEYPGTVLLFDERGPAATARYYARPDSFTAVQWSGGQIKNHYDLTANVANSKAHSFLYVSKLPEKASLDVARTFHYMRRLRPITIPLYPGQTQTYTTYLLKGFKGYE